jgi:hypothetical protein
MRASAPATLRYRCAAISGADMMRRLVACLICLAAVGNAQAQSAAPPHAWLFGAWTGGLFPAPPHPTAESCLAQPTVIFMRDVVLRATLTDVTYVQRVVATARTRGGHADFTFAPVAPPAAGSGLLGALQGVGTTPQGFGCASPDELHVERKSANEITFPGCADFPNPLVRCPGR